MDIKIIEEIDSSNNYLKDNYTNLSDKTLIKVNKQTNGRGRFNRVWESEIGDFMVSLLFKNNNYNHSLIAPLSIINTLAYFNINAYIKWPNDIYIDNNKLSGILIESIFQKGNKVCDIIGIGINFRKKDNYLAYLDKYNIDIERFLSIFVKNYEFMLEISNLNLLNLYKEKSIVLDKKVMFQNEEYFINDINLNVELILKNENKTIIVNANELDIKTSIVKF